MRVNKKNNWKYNHYVEWRYWLIGFGYRWGFTVYIYIGPFRFGFENFNDEYYRIAAGED